MTGFPKSTIRRQIRSISDASSARRRGGATSLRLKSQRSSGRSQPAEADGTMARFMPILAGSGVEKAIRRIAGPEAGASQQPFTHEAATLRELPGRYIPRLDHQLESIEIGRSREKVVREQPYGLRRDALPSIRRIVDDVAQFEAVNAGGRSIEL